MIDQMMMTAISTLKIIRNILSLSLSLSHSLSIWLLSNFYRQPFSLSLSKLIFLSFSSSKSFSFLLFRMLSLFHSDVLCLPSSLFCNTFSFSPSLSTLSLSLIESNRIRKSFLVWQSVFWSHWGQDSVFVVTISIMISSCAAANISKDRHQTKRLVVVGTKSRGAWPERNPQSDQISCTSFEY